jgi:hypothetical protein
VLRTERDDCKIAINWMISGQCQLLSMSLNCGDMVLICPKRSTDFLVRSLVGQNATNFDWQVEVVQMLSEYDLIRTAKTTQLV